MRSEGNSILLLLNHKPAHLVVRCQWWIFLRLFEGPPGELILSTNWLVKASTNSAMGRVVCGVVHHTSSCQSAAHCPHFHFCWLLLLLHGVTSPFHSFVKSLWNRTANVVKYKNLMCPLRKRDGWSPKHKRDWSSPTPNSDSWTGDKPLW